MSNWFIIYAVWLVIMARCEFCSVTSRSVNLTINILMKSRSRKGGVRDQSYQRVDSSFQLGLDLVAFALCFSLQCYVIDLKQ